MAIASAMDRTRRRSLSMAQPDWSVRIAAMLDQPSKRRNRKVKQPRPSASRRPAGSRFQSRLAPALAPAKSYSSASITTIRQRSAGEKTAAEPCKKRISSDHFDRSANGWERRSRSRNTFPKGRTSPSCSKRPMARSSELPGCPTAQAERSRPSRAGWLCRRRKVRLVKPAGRHSMTPQRDI